jgi:hypothetical protein
MTPTRDERINATARVEYFYRADHPTPPPVRETRVDQEGYCVWLGIYEDLREDGLDHETAIRAVEKGMRETVWPPPPPTTHPIKGQLRINGTAFVDDNGFVLPTLAHFGEAFSAWTRRPDDVKRQLDVIRDADYQGCRVWDCLGYYAGGWQGREVAPIAFKNDKGVTIPATPGYYDHLQRFLEAFKERGLVLHHSRGDLNSWGKDSILVHCQRVGDVQRAVGLPVIALNEACNEPQQNISDYSAAFLDQMIAAINNAAVLKALGDPVQNEDTDTLVKYARDVVYVHGYRGSGDGDPVGVLRHEHSLRYDGAVKVAGKAGWQGEPAGNTTSVAQVTRPDTLALMAMQAHCCRQAWVHVPANGIFWNGPIEASPGFREVAKTRHWLPADVMTYTDAFHGGATWKGKRVVVAEYPDGRLRADHRMRGKDLTITVHAKPGQKWQLAVERAFTGHVVDPITGPGDERTWQVGQLFEFDGRDRTGVLIVGRVL